MPAGIYKHQTGEKSSRWKGGKPKCSCGKQLTNYGAKTCHRCQTVSPSQRLKMSEAHKKIGAPWMIGISLSRETKEKSRQVQLCRVAEGIHNNYRGNEVGYRALHYWVVRVLGQPTQCQDCGINGLVGRQIHWANISRSYKRIKHDWIRLCAKCHKAFDSKCRAQVENQVTLT